MKIKTVKKSYASIMEELDKKGAKRVTPKKPNIFFRTLMKVVALPDLMATKFECRRIGMEKLGKKEPALFLMNHSSFIDLEIVASALYPRPFNIVATTDSFVGKGWLMRQIGCFPTKKFVLDLGLIRDMKKVLNEYKSSVVMFPEAGYSFDGTATTLPDTLGGLVKMLKAPVVMIETHGAFTRDPLYNGLQRRKIKVSADMKYLLSPEEIKEKSAEELNDIIKKEFSFDAFAWQRENEIRIDEDFRADFLDRTLYKCPHCNAEGQTEGKGIHLRCKACGAEYELDELGVLSFRGEGEAKFDHIPHWYAWQRECVRKEIEKGIYKFKSAVRILMSVDTKRIYDIGTGQLEHTSEGFTLKGDDGVLDYRQKPQASYSICSDFNWYEIGDVICIGNQKALYYCFPLEKGNFVAKTRLAAEELYKLVKKN